MINEIEYIIMILPKLIGIAGKKTSGKTLVADYLSIRYNYTVMNFADELKDMICVILDIDRKQLEFYKNCENGTIPIPMSIPMSIPTLVINDSHIELLAYRTGIDISLIEQEFDSKRTFKSIRHLLQFVGTQVIRKYKPNWHIECLYNKILNNHKNDALYCACICIGDMRFKNEKEFIENSGGKTIYIQRDSLNDSNDTHISENNLNIRDDIFDTILYNNKDIEALVRNIDVTMNRM